MIDWTPKINNKHIWTKVVVVVVWRDGGVLFRDYGPILLAEVYSWPYFKAYEVC